MADTSRNNNDGPSAQWNNETCIQIAFKDSFPSSVKDVNVVQKNIVINFLNFYLRGKTPKGLSVLDVAFAVLSIMPLHESTEEYIWEPFHYSDKGTLFSLQPESKVKEDEAPLESNTKGQSNKENQKDDSVSVTPKQPNVASNEKHVESNQEEQTETFKTGEKSSTSETFPEKDVNIGNTKETVEENNKAQSEPSKTAKNPIILPVTINWRKFKPQQGENVSGRTFTHLDVSAFNSSVNNILDNWTTDTEGRIVLKYFFGIVALVLMRATTKKFSHLGNTFSSSKFMTMISFADNRINYTMPHKRCFKNSYRIFRRRDGTLPVMFAKIIINSFRINNLKRIKLNNIVTNVFKMTLLPHTADYGFGIVNMLQNLASKNSSIQLIVDTTFCEETAESWIRIKNFLQKYMVNESKEATHHWAKILNSEYFSELACKSNFPLAIILAVYTENITGKPDIWNSTWVSSGEDLDKWKEIGSKMYQEFLKNMR